MTLPFTTREFFDVFGRYNAAVWPAQLLLYGIAVLITANVIRQARPRLVLMLLAALWLWMGLVYHLTFFADINPAARVFGIAFIAQAGILLWPARPRPFDRSGSGPRLERLAGKALVFYALLGYPLVGLLAGHSYPEAPTMGTPCPTTIFTLGVLLWMRDSPAWAFAIPLLWSVVGTSAAVELSVPQDYGLAIAGVAGFVLLERAVTSQVQPTPSASATRLM